MPRLEIPRIVLTRNPSQADLITAAKWGAVLNADDAQFVSTGREVLLCRNTSGAAIVVTLITTANAGFARVGSSPTLSVPAGGVGVFGPIPQDGFIRPDGLVFVAVPADGMLMAILELPGSTYYAAN